jgi:hypothetical protein
MGMSYSKLFEPTLLTATPATILTVPSGSASMLLKGAIVRLTNTSNSPVSVSLYSVPVAGSNGATNNFFPAKSVPANDYIDVQVPQMKAGDFLQGSAVTASVVNIQPIAGAYYS